MEKMKNKYCILLLLVLFNMPLIVYSQCADYLKEGESLMAKKKYKSAITYFQRAKECDNSLAKKSDEYINNCRKYLRQSEEKVTQSYIITISSDALDFGAESTSSQSVKVECEAEWKCSSDSEWCSVVKMNEKSLSITCSINKSTDDRTAIVRLDNEKETKSIQVVQKGVDGFLDIIPDQVDLGKEGDILSIPLKCNTSYEIGNKPDWLNVMAKEKEMIIVEIGAYKFSGKENVRQGVLSVVTPDGKSDFVIIAQHKKYKRPDKDSDKRKKEKNKEKSEKKKGFLGIKL